MQRTFILSIFLIEFYIYPMYLDFSGVSVCVKGDHRENEEKAKQFSHRINAENIYPQHFSNRILHFPHVFALVCCQSMCKNRL